MAEEPVILQTGSSSSCLCSPTPPPHSCTWACAPVGQPSPSEALYSRRPRRVDVTGLELEQWTIPMLHLFPRLTGSALSSPLSLSVFFRLWSFQSLQVAFLLSLGPVFPMLLAGATCHIQWLLNLCPGTPPRLGLQHNHCVCWLCAIEKTRD